MKIGIDLDGVIFDTEREFRVNAELYDVIELKRDSMKENSEVRFQERYDWNNDEKDKFLKLYQEEITKNSDLMPGAKRVLKMLKDDGHTLAIITARGEKNKKLIEITKNILQKENMDIFDEYYWGTRKKYECCIENKIELMIDDSPENCKELIKNKIKTIYFKDSPTKEIEESEYLKTVYGWGEIYKYIKLNEN